MRLPAWIDLPERFPAVAAWGAVALLLLGGLIGVADQRNDDVRRTRDLTVQAEILAASVSAALTYNDTSVVR